MGHPRWSVMARKKEKSDSGGRDNQRCQKPILQGPRDLSKLGFDSEDSDTQNEVDPEAEVPRETAVLTVRWKPYPRPSATVWGMGQRGHVRGVSEAWRRGLDWALSGLPLQMGIRAGPGSSGDWRAQ